MYKQKYIKYKTKYIDLLNKCKNQLGGEFRTKIDNCEKISIFMEELYQIISNNITDEYILQRGHF